MATLLPFNIDRSTLAGGISGLLTWGATIGLASLGVVVPPTSIAPLCLLVATLFVHFVPDAAKVDAQIKDLANLVPTVDPVYPGDVKQTASEQAWKTK